MTYLVNWISQIIILMMFMVIISMILPDHKMKKYVQFSLSLIFILFFIQPITELFNLNIGSESDKVIDFLFDDDASKSVEDGIELQKKEIQAYNDAYVIEELANQLKNNIEESLINEFGYTLTDVVIDPALSGSLDFQDLIFHFYFDQAQQHTGEIAPITIDQTDQSHQEHDDFDYDRPTLLNWLSQELEVDQEQVILYWEGG
ncbi:stage III sporulation protein AF [Amphibacillus cookii]|uniref:stage III sporulation protein AF n=1 Tax=Amphibacillus cookii TaxID=767787 RepID=UPI00195DE520|nr:stage III sporulation protein AF [Amphibacillus cookii]MBM7542432.1 stage III sporulation protein AF [Amphibacillus cookii]